MDIFQAIVLALIQGATEFLPVSSSAHLILLPNLLNWQDQGLAFDVIVHLGTLTAVIFHYRSLLFKHAASPLPTQYHPLLLAVVSSIPVLIIAYLIEGLVSSTLRTPLVIAFSTIGFGILLGIADYKHTGTSKILTLRLAVLIGMAQALALIPGTSRAGIILTAGLLLGISREHATHFSFLTAIPVISAAALYEGMKLTVLPQPELWPLLGIGFMVSAITAVVTISLFLRLVRMIGLFPFVVYRIALGTLLLFLFW